MATNSIQSAVTATNLDVNSIVSQLMTVERRPLDLLASQAQSYQTQISAYGSLKSAMSSFQASLLSLNDASRFAALTASVGDSTIASASATSDARVGTYSLEVDTLAQQQKLRSTTFSDPLATVGSGTLTFQFGTYDSNANSFTLNADKPAQTVSIAAGQNTLAGIRDAVNNAGIGVTASIVNDGTSSRLVFTSTDSGTKNSLKIGVADNDGTNTNMSGLSQLAYDPTATKNLTETVAAKDATLKLDGISITSSSNTVTDAMAGLTLNLQKADSNTVTTISVQRDKTTVQNAVQTLVKAYNQFDQAIDTLTKYDPTSKQSGPLLGDSLVLSTQSRVRSLLTSSVPGGTYTTLSQIGVSFQLDGSLALDSSKLGAALDAHPEDIGALFAKVGRPTDTRVSYVSATAATKPGTYALQISQPATKGSLAASAAAGLTITAGVNDVLGFTVNGTSVSMTLGAGVYATAAALASELQSKLNGALQASGSSVQVATSAGTFTVTSNKYGAASGVSVASGVAADNLFGATPTATAGLDVAGTLAGASMIGSGQTLLGPAGTAVEGLQLRTQATAAGSYGTVTYSTGIVSQIVDAMDAFLSDGGGVASRIDGLNRSLKTNGDRQTEEQARLDQTQQQLMKQYTALNQLIASMNTTSTYLTQQLSALPKIGG